MIRFGPLIEALGRAEPDATILMFSWIDQSATADDLFDARVGEDATEINGHRLAVAVDQALAERLVGRTAHHRAQLRGQRRDDCRAVCRSTTAPAHALRLA